MFHRSDNTEPLFEWSKIGCLFFAILFIYINCIEGESSQQPYAFNGKSCLFRWMFYKDIRVVIAMPLK